MRVSSSLVPDDVRERCDSVANELMELGVGYVGHGVVCRNGCHTGYFSNHEWGKRYFENGYFFVEPILDVLENDLLNFVDWDPLRYQFDKHAVTIQRYHLNRLTAGFTVSSDLNGHKEYLNLGFKIDGNYPKLFFQNRKLIQDYFYAFRNAHTLHRI